MNPPRVERRRSLGGLALLPIAMAGATACNARKVTPSVFADELSPDASGDVGRSDTAALPDVSALPDAGPRDGALRAEAGCSVDDFALPPMNYPERVSVGPTRMPGNGLSTWATISGDGDVVVFQSEASDLVADDTNGLSDIFLRDRRSGTTSRISVTAHSGDANGRSYWPRVSADGRWVVFTSHATNFADPAAPPGVSAGVYLYGVDDGRLQRIDGAAAARTGETGSSNGFVSSDGSRVVFQSDVSGLTPGDTNRSVDTYLWERETRRVSRISVTPDGAQARAGAVPLALSATGTVVAMRSAFGDLAAPAPSTGGVFVHDLRTGLTRAVPPPLGAPSTSFSSTSTAALSRDGRYLAFVTITWPPTRRESETLFLFDGETNATVEVARGVRSLRATSGEPAQVAISHDGQRLAWTAETRDPAAGCPAGLNGIVVYDRTTGSRRWQRLSRNDDGRSRGTRLGGLNADGTMAAFTSNAGDLPGGSPEGVAQTYVMPVDPNR